MIQLKNKDQLEGVRTSCKLLAEFFQEIKGQVVAGIKTEELDRWAVDWIRRKGGRPAFLGYGPAKNPFPGALCISINNEVIHGIPGKRRIEEGDLVSLDCGIDFAGYYSDMAITVAVPPVSEEARLLSERTEEALYKGISQVKRGARIHDIGRAVFEHASSFNYGVVYDYCGHGVGFSPHEDPSVPNLPRGPNPRLHDGLVIAIEPMINLGTGAVNLESDGWTVVTADGSLSAHWEHTVAVVDGRCEVLTAIL